MFVKGLNMFCIQVVICDCIAVEITGSGDHTLLAGFIYARHILLFSSNCTKDNFSPKSLYVNY
jgi:hypothetical protein